MDGKFRSLKFQIYCSKNNDKIGLGTATKNRGRRVSDATRSMQLGYASPATLFITAGRPASARFSDYLMSAISIATYTVEVKALRDKAPLMLKFQSGERGASVRQTVLSELTKLKECRDSGGQLFRVTRLEHEGPDIWGTIARGEYGAALQLISAQTLSETYLQKTDEAAMRPYYFRLHLPDGATKGLLLIQRTGVHGAYSGLRAELESGFKAKHPENRLRFARAIHDEMLRDILGGAVHSYELVAYASSTDAFDWLKHKGPKPHSATITFTAEPERGKSLWDVTPAWIDKVIRGEMTVAQVWPNQSVKSLRLRMTYKGQPRWFDLTEPEDLFPYIVLDPKDVSIGPNGHPEFEKIHEACSEICEGLKVKFGLKEASHDLDVAQEG